jgi:hypothetical protein
MAARRTLLSPLLTVACLVALIPGAASGQGIPWYTIPLPIPNGLVDAATGNVHLEIPLGPKPEPARNGDPAVNSLVYDSNNNTWNPFAGNSHTGTASLSPGSQPCPSGYPNGSVAILSNPFFLDNHYTTHTSQNANAYL